MNDLSILTESARLIIPVILSSLSRRIRKQQQDYDKVAEAIQRHLVEVSNWVRFTQFLGMASPNSTEDATIALDLYTAPRRFQSADDPSSRVLKKGLIVVFNGQFYVLRSPGMVWEEF